MAPIFMALLMGRRSMKMDLQTYILSFLYWLVLAIEACDLLESAVLNHVHQHVVYTTEAIVSIIMIISCSYSIVTLCSFISPVDRDHSNTSLPINKLYRKFNVVYRIFVGVSGILLGELPFLIARVQIMFHEHQIIVANSTIELQEMA